APHRPRRTKLQRGAAAGPQAQRVERALGPPYRHVDQVGDDGTGGRHLSGAAAVVERVADDVAKDMDRRVSPAAQGQRRIVPQQYRRDVQGELVVAQPRLGEQLDRVAQLARVANVEGVNAGNAAPLDGVKGDGHAKGDLGEDGELVDGVGAVHIE